MVFSRVLRDSIGHYVGRSVGLSRCHGFNTTDGTPTGGTPVGRRTNLSPNPGVSEMPKTLTTVRSESRSPFKLAAQNGS